MDISIGAFAAILPYLDQANLKNLYVDTTSWENQTPAVARTIVPPYLCPSNTGPEIDTNPVLAAYPIGTEIGALHYLLSKGSTGGWCLSSTSTPGVGMFAINLRTNFRDLTDGSSNTLCVGEGATGGAWVVAAGTAPNTGLGSPTGRVQQGWIAPQPNPLGIQAMSGYTTAGNFGTTQWKLNRNPIIETVYDDAGLGSCTSAGDYTSNFRSSHEGGGQFLLGDGSGRFISENIDQGTYDALATRAGSEIVGEF